PTCSASSTTPVTTSSKSIAFPHLPPLPPQPTFPASAKDLRPPAIFWRCIDANSAVRKFAAAYSASIDGSWMSIGSSSASQQLKNEERLTGQSATTQFQGEPP